MFSVPCHCGSLSQPPWTLGGSGIYGEGLFLGSYSLKNPIDGHGPQTSCLGEAPWQGGAGTAVPESSPVPPLSLLTPSLHCSLPYSDLRVQREEATLHFGTLVLVL